MGDFSLTVTIEQPAATVFAFLGEPANMTRWYDAVDQVTIAAGVIVESGTKFEIARSLPGGPAINEVEVTEYMPSRRITFESRRGPTPFRYRYTVEPVGDARCSRSTVASAARDWRVPPVVSPPSRPSSSSAA